MGMFGSAGKSFASDLGHAALNQAGIMFMGRNFDREHEKKAQLDAILGQVLGTSAPGVGSADIVKPPTAMIGRGPGFMSSGQMPGPMQLPPGATPQMPTPGELNMPGVASMGGGVDMGAPVKQPSPIGLEDPRLPGLALAAKRAGLDLSSYIDVLKANQPDIRYDRGFGYNGKTGASAGGYHPDLEKGQEPLYDGRGNVVGVRNMDGSIQAAADMAGAVKGAEAAAQAPYQAVQTQDPSGRPMTINAAQLARGAGGQGAPFLGQSSAQTAADTARATAGANAEIGLPQSQADAQQAVQLIQTLKANPALHDRTGWKSLLPAMPGTPGAAFDAADDQLRGKLFLQAYAGLKGGGQITEVEGKKATQAMARLSRSQSAEDYTAALNDLETVIQAGLGRAQQQPGRLQPNASGAARPAAPNRSAIEAEMRRRGLIH